MTTFKEPLREYSFTDARLIEIGLEKIAFANRDAAELATMGVTAPWVADLNTKILNFGAMPSDEVELGEQQEATTEKDEDVDDLRDKLKDLRSAAQRAFGDKSPKYNQFGLRYLDDTSDAELLKKGMVAAGVAATYTAELTAKGFDGTDITELQTLVTTLVGGLQNQSMEIGSRDTAQENRVIAGNEVYDLLQNELCEAGKAYWRTLSAAKYNDYLIYNNATGTSGINAVREADVPAGATLNINIDGVQPTASSVVITVVTGGPLKFYASATEGGDPIDVIYELPVGTASDTIEEYEDLTGVDPSVNFLTVRNTGAVTAHYKITVTNVVE